MAGISLPCLASNGFKTAVFSPKIKTLTVNVVDNWGVPPVIELEDGREIEIQFDELSSQPTRFVYTLTHCNADWTPSQLQQSEFMSGFQYLPIQDYDYSKNTRVDYINYKIFLPNQDLTMKVSGNYLVKVFREDDQSKVILTACFAVKESLVDIDMEISSNTDIDFNKEHQQVSFSINLGNNKTIQAQDIKAFVQQNSRTDNQTNLLKVQSIIGNRLDYNHNRNLIFEAGNEYRRFEMITTAYNGMGIESVDYFEPYHHVSLKQDLIRSKRVYSFDKDQNGRIFIRSANAIDYSTESEYCFVHFSLLAEKPFAEDVYILSEMYNYNLDENSRIDYNIESKAYEKTELLKQGVYNYMYVCKKPKTEKAYTALIEGNYYQTENEYTLWVYHRPFGGRYDKLIGVKTF
ncbi:DUF5103 domain-containing protein [Bacteroidales bacterium]|nr:DUF5103 domain-containing protein [Bacteroidales bacterium]